MTILCRAPRPVPGWALSGVRERAALIGSYKSFGDLRGGLSIEGGARVRYERVQAEAVYFHTLFDDMIVRVAAGEMSGSIPILTKENSGEGHMHGIELSASVKVHRDWALWGNWTWMRGELDREDYRIHGSGVNEAGGYFVMTARVQF